MEKTLKINKSVLIELPDGKRIAINVYSDKGKRESIINVTDKDGAGAYLGDNLLFIQLCRPKTRKKFGEFGVRATDLKLSPMVHMLVVNRKTNSTHAIEAIKLNKKQLTALKSKSG